MANPKIYWFDDSFRQSEDIECWLRIALQTHWRIEGLPEALTLYRVKAAASRPTSRSSTPAWERVLDKTAISLRS